MKKLFALLVSVLVGGWLMAAPISAELAHRVAYQFSRLSAPDGVKLTPSDVVDVTASTGYHEFYIFSLGETGFVMVSGDDCAVPILGYSFTSPLRLKNVPAQISTWLDSYEHQLAWLRDNGAVATDAVGAQWQALSAGALPVAALPSAVSPLLTTTWDQNPYYNNLCPGSGTGSNRTVTGCVATATAQVMKFWNHPATGRGSHSYTDDNYGTQSADFGNTTYEWSIMPNSLGSSSTSDQDNAVATLMYHIGVAVEMDYGLESTGGSAAAMQCYGYASTASSEQALVTYFRYQPTVHCISLVDYSDAEWASMLRAELDLGRPMLYEGDDADAGHCFVCDGYDNSNRFHFNWGWGGSYDGYYAIGSLNLGGGGTGTTSSYTFNLRNGALLGIQPMTTTAGSSTTVTASANNSSYGTVLGTGTFNSFVDTVSLTARANAGYRFECWSDGYKHNPRQFVAPGGSHSFTAVYAPIAGDTITYSGRRRMGQTSVGSPTEWGIRIPANSLTNGTSLEKVRVYIPSTGSYSVVIYKGTNSPATQVYSGSFTATSAGGWATLDMPTPVTVDVSQAMFITFSSSASYPAAYSYYCGNNDGSWIKYGGNWVTLSGVTWMIDAIFSDGTGPFTITAVANNSNWGSVSGGGTYAAGTSVWLEASPNTGYHFVSWQDGVTTARRQITVTANATYTATFASDNGDDCTVSNFPWTEDFEGDIDCWTVLDADGDGYSWNLNPITASPHGGSGFIGSASYINNVGSLNPDNWLISPRINLPSQSAQIEWWDFGADVNDYAEHYGLYVSTTGTNPSDFTPIWVGTVPSSRTWRQLTQSLNAYRGQSIYFAFRHYDCTNQFWLLLDDLKITGSGSVGIDDVNSFRVAVYPNPTTGRFHIDAEGFKNVEVFDATGRSVMASDRNVIDLSSFANGVYTLRVNTVEGSSMQKIVKK